MARLQGKVALITGGTSGIGLATAKLFVAEGAKVIVTGQDAERVAEAARILGPNGLAVRANAASATDMADVARRIEREFGGLDVVFANAGIARPAALPDVTEAHVAEHLDVNVKGVIYTVKSVLRILRKPASVILNASTVAELGMAGMSVYAATKAAVRSLGRSLAAELVGQGIRVNVVSPGPIETPIYGKLGLPAAAVDEMAKGILAMVPQGRFGQAEEVAKAVLFLATEDSSYMVGEDIRVDGGMGTI